MEDNREYEKFAKFLTKEYFSLNEVRKFIDNDFVINVTEQGPDPKRKNYVKYAVTLLDGDIYYVYVTP